MQYKRTVTTMPFWVSICIAFAVGAVFGFIMAAVLMANERDDRP